MSHRRTQNRLSAYLDRELDSREHERVRAHLVECAACRAELEELSRVVALVRELPDPQLSHSLSRDVLRNLESHPPGPVERMNGWFRDNFGGGPLSPLAAAALGVGLVAWVQFSEPDATEGPRLAAARPPAAASPTVTASAKPREARRLVGAVADPGTPPQPIPRHFAECRTRGSNVRECEDLYYAWLMSQAHEDPPGFAQAARALPSRRLEKLHSFAVGSGSGPWVWRSVREAGGPGAERLAAKLVQPASAGR